jgi:hypothetical protein
VEAAARSIGEAARRVERRGPRQRGATVEVFNLFDRGLYVGESTFGP